MLKALHNAYIEDHGKGSVWCTEKVVESSESHFTATGRNPGGNNALYFFLEKITLEKYTLLQQAGIQVVIMHWISCRCCQPLILAHKPLVLLPPTKSAMLNLRSCLAPECTLLSLYVVIVKVYRHCVNVWLLSRNMYSVHCQGMWSRARYSNVT